METCELDIIQSCQQGNLEGFAQLYDKYIKKIYSFIYFRTHHQQTAEDLTSISFNKALEKINKFNSQKGNFSSWLYQIARNTVIDHYRTNKNETNINDIWDLNSNNDIPADLDNRLKLEKIAEYLKLLNQKQRELIIMRVWDGLSYQEISAITKKSESSLKMTFSRAMKTLRQENALALIILLSLIK